jgi:hypothetical protein
MSNLSEEHVTLLSRAANSARVRDGSQRFGLTRRSAAQRP